MRFFKRKVIEEKKVDNRECEENNKLSFKEELIALANKRALEERKKQEEVKKEKKEEKEQVKAIKERLKFIKAFVDANLTPLLADINTVIFSGEAKIEGPKEKIFSGFLWGKKDGSVGIKLIKGGINLEVAVHYNDNHIEVCSDNKTRLSFSPKSLEDPKTIRIIEENFLDYLKSKPLPTHFSLLHL